MSLGRGPDIIHPWEPAWETPPLGEMEDAVLRAVEEGHVAKADLRRAELALPADQDPTVDRLFTFWRERGILKARLRT